VPETLSRFEYAQVSIPIAILIWAMIFPMMAQIDFSAVIGVRREPKGLAITTAVNWLIKPLFRCHGTPSFSPWCCTS
jgi:ACR3 family arsenite transporter